MSIVILYPPSHEDTFSDFRDTREAPLSKSDTLLNVLLVFPEIVMVEKGGDCAKTRLQNRIVALIMKT
jgi:hypothetical protein